jgi:transcriptional regulator NrdR family protein
MDQDLLAYLEQRFASIDRRFQETGQNIQALREEMTQRFASVDQSFENLETEVRDTWVTIEDLYEAKSNS